MYIAQLVSDKNRDKSSGLNILNTVQRTDGKRKAWTKPGRYASTVGSHLWVTLQLSCVDCIFITHVPYPHKTTKHRPTPHFGLNFLLRSNIHLNMHPCVATLEKCGLNGWFMSTELRIVYVRLISNLSNSRKSSYMPHFEIHVNDRVWLAIVTMPT